MDMEPFKVIIVEDVKLELKGTEQIFRAEIPEATIIGTAQNESEFWKLMRAEVPDLVLLDLGLGGSTTVGVDICRQIRSRYDSVKILIFTGEVLNEKLWIEVLNAGAQGIILKTGNLLQRDDVMLTMHGRRFVFNEPILEKILFRYRKLVMSEAEKSDALLDYEIDEYDERYLRHLALGYTKEMISNLRNMPFGAKSLEKRQIDLINRLFPESERFGVNATRLVTKAFQLHILDPNNLEADEE
ncbi:MAG: response regulator transcription factor [Bacteroidaceae bacterium]|nr:response regulator transcription factor [Bacteroidaceae bacterium]MBQ2459687.1 response regulator transcription factor [Bacteroidaceae bacterium]MBQ2595284.1 response regulator transcription factor [Bacteroidaceae bacterium]MBQ3958268.1 response regulator transcription factor [Bacteroidaceae bacterium]MBQ3991705.1 response regulator transcription factor [Bacteroidaceae bacterium]